MKSQDQLAVRNLGSLLDENFKIREDVISPWFTQKNLCLVYSPTGIGKSFWAWSMALAIAGGGKFADWSAPKARKVLFVDGEMDVQDLQERADLLIDHLGLDLEVAKKNLILVARQDQAMATEFPDLNQEEGQERVLELIKKHKPEVVILDNFSTLCEIEDENNASSFNGVMQFLLKLKQGHMSAILVHHSRKKSNGKGAYRGTSKMAVVFNSIISLNEPSETLKSPEGGASFVLEFEKSRAKRDSSMEPKVWTLGEDGWKAELDENNTLNKLVAAIRSKRFADQASLGEHFGHSSSWVTKNKKKAITIGLITKDEWIDCLKKGQALKEIEGKSEEELESWESVEDDFPDEDDGEY